MEFRILGPLEVIGPDGPLLLRGAKRRGLLAFLLVQRGQVISSDRLVEALGDGEAGSGALGTIQTYLSQLRKILPQVGGELVTQPSGYVFDVPDDAVDAARFEAMVRAASAEPDSGGRLRLLDGALGLWRGRRARRVRVAVGAHRTGAPRTPPPRRAVAPRGDAPRAR